MKVLNVIFAIAAVSTILLLLAYHADAPDITQDPNPMKHNQEQFARMGLTNNLQSVK
ncbi:hypothetical protein [Paenibacillus qinlingensis]|uniref:hypothetical protein n=1 Tax=Paenibacillus qinlingensis TaxID=1837343 RepID=UPI001563F349|nr:hypothetical protein [Paenibacillus qinlingensis]NQX59562.1 hypothetical protein [Paenibacillus qinlingensis]